MRLVLQILEFAQTADGVLSDGNEVYLNTEQLADVYRLTTIVPETFYLYHYRSLKRISGGIYLLYARSGAAVLWITAGGARLYNLQVDGGAVQRITPPVGQYAIQCSQAPLSFKLAAVSLSLPTRLSNSQVRELVVALCSPTKAATSQFKVSRAA